MKTDSKGRGIIPGVESDIEYKDRKYQEERSIFSNILSNTMEELTSLVSIVSADETYKCNQVLEMAAAVIRGIKEIESKAGRTGSVRVTIRPELEKCKVEATYNNPLWNEEKSKIIGKITNKPALYDKEHVSAPVHCEQYDEIRQKYI